ncbi:MAG: hypothetical protein AAGA35_02305 [Patescibacteria group bacterium]
MVYFRFPDGRIWFFRGQYRRQPFFTDCRVTDNKDWVNDQDMARLFEKEPDVTNDRLFDKNVRFDQKFRQKLNMKPFDETVLRSHLIVPEKIKKLPPG